MAKWLVSYPIDVSKAEQNANLAKEILDMLETSGSTSVPTAVAEYVENLNQQSIDKSGWRVELLSDKTTKQGLLHYMGSGI